MEQNVLFDNVFSQIHLDVLHMIASRDDRHFTDEEMPTKPCAKRELNAVMALKGLSRQKVSYLIKDLKQAGLIAVLREDAKTKYYGIIEDNYLTFRQYEFDRRQQTIKF